MSRTTRLGCAALTAAVAIVWPARSAIAQTDNWIGGSSDWNTPSNWDGGVVPQAGDTVNVINTDGTSPTITYDYPEPAVTLGLLTVSATNGGTETFSMTTPGETLSTSDQLIGGDISNLTTTLAAAAVMTQSAGTNSTDDILFISFGATDQATYSLSGTGVLTAAQAELIGYRAVGSFIQSGGSNSTPDLDVGQMQGVRGTYSLGGSASLTVSSIEAIGYFGTGAMVQTGGSNTITSSLAGNGLFLGFVSGAVGTYSLSGTGSLTAPNEYLGGDSVFQGNIGTGIFNQSGGSNTVGTLYLGFTQGSTGSYNLSGNGKLTAAVVNISPLGSFTQTGGTASLAQITGAGTVAITGGQSSLTPSGGASTVSALTVSSGGILDITNNRLVINFGAGVNDPVNAITAALASGYNAGAWTGPGITSSAAAADPARFSVGYLDGDNPRDTVTFSPYGKPAVAPGQIIIAYTLTGDAFLQGSVGFADLVEVAMNIGHTGLDWAGGNFTYDPSGSVGFADLVLVAQEFGDTTPVAAGETGPSGLSPVWQTAQSQAVVPEPATIAIMAIGAAGLLSRRHRFKRPD